MLFLEINGGVGNKHEQEADEFATNFLIPKEKANALRFIAHTKADIKAFADDAGVASGIVVGRMQYEKYLSQKSYLNKLKVHYVWKTK